MRTWTWKENIQNLWLRTMTLLSHNLSNTHETLTMRAEASNQITETVFMDWYKCRSGRNSKKFEKFQECNCADNFIRPSRHATSIEIYLTLEPSNKLITLRSGWRWDHKGRVITVAARYAALEVDGMKCCCSCFASLYREMSRPHLNIFGIM